MSLLSENVLPGKHGKIFSTNAKEKKDLELIRTKIISLKGIKEVIINSEVFPREFTVYTSKLLKIVDIENQVKSTKFHVIPKDLFEL